MALSVRLDGDVVVLSDFGRLMNDPRHFDAGRDVAALLEEGRRQFVIDLTNLRETGDAALGLLVGLTRQVRNAGGEAVLAHVRPEAQRFLAEMRLDDHWDTYDNVAAAVAALGSGRH